MSRFPPCRLRGLTQKVTDVLGITKWQSVKLIAAQIVISPEVVARTKHRHALQSDCAARNTVVNKVLTAMTRQKNPVVERRKLQGPYEYRTIPKQTQPSITAEILEIIKKTPAGPLAKKRLSVFSPSTLRHTVLVFRQLGWLTADSTSRQYKWCGPDNPQMSEVTAFRTARDPKKRKT
jgi:hypothetical protein